MTKADIARSLHDITEYEYISAFALFRAAQMRLTLTDDRDDEPERSAVVAAKNHLAKAKLALDQSRSACESAGIRVTSHMALTHLI